jgi:hypothetical protein
MKIRIATDNSVRDFPQQVIIPAIAKGGIITVKNRISTIGTVYTYSFPLADWEAAGRAYNPNWAWKELIIKNTKRFYTDDDEADPQVDRIRDAQIGAIKKALSKNPRQSMKETTMKEPKVKTSNIKLWEGIGIGLAVAFLGVGVWSVFFRIATVSGVVKNKSTGEPIPGINVRLIGDEGTDITVTSDAKGLFTFGQVGRTSYSYQGYQYVYAYDITVDAAGYIPHVLNDLVFHPADNFFVIDMEAI